MKIAKRGFTVAPNKYDYFFGRVIGESAARSRQIQRVLSEIGIEDAPEGHSKLEAIFEQGLNAPEVNRRENPYGVTISRAVQVGGKKLLIGYFYEGNNLTATPKVTTIIPKE